MTLEPVTNCGLVASSVSLLIQDSRKNDYFNSKGRNLKLLIIAPGHWAMCSACISHK